MPKEDTVEVRQPFDYAAAAATTYDPNPAAAPPEARTDEPAPADAPPPVPEPPAFTAPEPPPEPPPLDRPESATPGASIHAPAPEKPPATPRFASIDEAETGYANLQRRFQQVAGELKAVKEAENRQHQEAYDRQLGEAKERQFDDFVKTRFKAYEAARSDLDPNDSGYEDAAANLEAEYQRDLTRFKSAPPELPDDMKPAPFTPAPVSDPAAPVDPLDDPREFVGQELQKHGLSMEDPFLRHVAGGLPPLGAKLEDGRTVTLPVQMELLIDRATTETLSRYCQQSAAQDLPGIDISHPVLQHYVQRASSVDSEGKPVPFYDRMQAAVRETRKWQAEERRKLLAQHDLPLPASFGPGPSPQAAPTAPSSMGSVIDRVREQSRL